ncbi:glycoside hydrolase family protein [Vibrio sp. HN007]|uniref:glycoside hydrolase family protein n=1 Tax=Vibrio iocasae TaxID=3098914 RepID=UPI0035D49AB5
MLKIATQLLKKHEGLRLKPYHCTANKLTIGYGRNIEDNGISEAEAEVMLQHDINRTLEEAKTLPFFSSLNETRQAVIVDMMFNLGFNRFKKFERMLIALERNNYNMAAIEMLDSRWAVQVGKRADELSQLMRSGQYEHTH